MIVIEAGIHYLAFIHFYHQIFYYFFALVIFFPNIRLFIKLSPCVCVCAVINAFALLNDSCYANVRIRIHGSEGPARKVHYERLSMLCQSFLYYCPVQFFPE